jgi:two-component system nitrogen regulation response regulator NtrX
MGVPLREARESFEREYLRIQIRRFSGNISRPRGSSAWNARRSTGSSSCSGMSDREDALEKE